MPRRRLTKEERDVFAGRFTPNAVESLLLASPAVRLSIMASGLRAIHEVLDQSDKLPAVKGIDELIELSRQIPKLLKKRTGA